MKTPKMKKTKSPLSANESFWGYAFIAPAVIGLLVFTLLPVLMSLFYSFTKFDGITDPIFVGLKNYKYILSDDEFFKAILNNLYYIVFSVPVGTFLAILIAVALNQKIKFVGVYRTLFFLPVVVSFVSIAMVWQWLYNTDYGLINSILGALGLYQPPWLTSEAWAMPSIIIMSIWKGLGFSIVILLASLQSIPSQLYEAADIDGANGAQKLFRITIPMLKNTIVFLTIMGVIGGFQIFDQIYVMTAGGPAKSTQVAVYLLYTNGFEYYKQGKASAMAYVLFIIVFVLSALQLKATREKQDIKIK